MDPPRTRWLEVEGRPVHAASWTPNAAAAAANRNASPVLLVHGLGGSSVNWHPTGRLLADALGRETLAVDLPGFGRTPPAGKASTVANNGRLLAALLREQGPGVVVGNSMGGAIAVGLAARHPDLVEALVLVDPALPFPRRVASAGVLRGLSLFAVAAVPVAGPTVMQWRSRRLGPARVVDATLRNLYARPERVDAELRRRMVELAAARQDLPHAARAYHDALRSLVPYLARRMAAEIATVKPPTLLVHGTHDRLVPVPLAERAAQRRPDWGFELLDDCGHVPHMEVPHRFVAAVAAWLADQALPGEHSERPAPVPGPA